MAGFRIAFTGSSGYLTCNMDCEHEISDSILIGYNNYGGGDGEPVYARRSAIFNANMGAAAGYLMLAAIIVDVSEQIPTFADTLFWRSGYDVMLNQTGIETGNYHGYFGYCSGGNLYGAYNDADIPVFSDMDEFYEYISSSPSQTSGGGAGSGYIGNSLVSNKKMVGYNVPTSSAESTKTESVNDVSASAVSGKPKSGNGFARIKLIAEPMPTQNLEYFRKNAGRFDNYVSFNMQDVIKSNDAKPYLLGDKDIVGYPGGGSWSYSYDSTSDTYTISTGSQVDYNFAVNRIQNPYRVIIECDVEPSSGRQAWISLVATYVNNDGNAVEVASSEGDNFLWISESIHMRLVFYNDVLPYIDYIRTATGNGPWSNFRISNFKITLFQ